TRTHDNLKAAFGGESQANRRYLYFAAKADVEGHNDVSALFRSTAEGETGHAHGHLEYLEAVGDPATNLPIGRTRENLKAAVAGETHEYTDMYPGMAKSARDEGFGENVDFPHVMLRAKAIKFKKGAKLRDRLLSSTDALGKLAAIPVVAQTVNAVNRLKPARAAMQAVLGVHKDRELPPYAPKKFRAAAAKAKAFPVRDGKNTPGKVAI